MQIRVICPRCERVYHVDADLVGKKMLCPNRMCGDIFEVQPASGNPDPPLPEAVDLVPMPSDPGQGLGTPAGQGGNVGDMVPILPAEAVPVPVAELVGPHDRSVPTFTAELDDGPATKDWRRSPPPNTGQRSGPERQADDKPGPAEKRHSKRRRPVPEPKTQDAPAPVGPTEFAPGTWAAPPVRGEAVAETPAAEAVPEEPASDHIQTPPAADDDLEKQFADAARRRRRRRLLVGGGLLATIAAVVAVLVIFLPGWLGQNEEQRYAHARELYDQGKFPEALKEFQELAKIQDSEHHADYEFLAGLSDVRQRLPRVNPDIAGASEVLHQLVAGHEKDPHVSQYGRDIWQATQVLISHYAQAAKSALADKHANLAQVKKDLDEARNWLAVSDRYPPQVVPGSERRALEEDVKTQDAALTRANARQAALSQAGDLKQFPADSAGLKKLDDWLREKGYADDEDFQAVRDALRQRVLRAVQYVELRRPPASKLPAEDPGLVVGVPAGKAVSGDRVPVTFAVARGVLYALRADDLTLLWFTRVGHDTTRPPVRLPRDSVHQAVLVLSSDTNTLTARDIHTGHVLWAQTLGNQPCVAWPLVLDRLAYVPTTDGTVHVIETNEGYEIGKYQLGGMQLDLGGVPQPGTDLVYFAANRDNIYVLNVKSHTCVGILSTNHGAKTLEGAPVIISRAEARAALGKSAQELPDYLVLTVQAEGGTKMRVLRLGAKGTTATEEPVDVTIPGFASFPPYSDPEKMVQVTDAAQAAVLGIGQPGNSDPPLFEQSVNSVLRQGTQRQAERCQVVYARENDFWILANGELQRWHYDLFRQHLTPVWDAPLRLGEPLHAAEASGDGKVLDVVTQAVPQETCLVTAVSADTGKVLTRRQVGFMSQGEPLVLSNGEVAALDRGGSFFVFKPAATAKGAGTLSTGHMLGGPVAVSGSASYLLPAADGHSVLQITGVQQGAKQADNQYQLLIRRYTPGQPLAEKTLDLGSWQLAGTPGVEKESIVVPLSSHSGTGVLRRCFLSDGSSFDGPNWRPSVAAADSQCQMLALADGDLLVSDGGSHLRRYNWPVGRATNFELKSTLEMPVRLVAAPLLLPSDAKHPGPRILVADVEKNVRLFEGPTLAQKRQWTLKQGEHFSAAPYLSGGCVGCVLDKHTLVWYRPDAEKMQSYQLKESDVEIVGRPQILGGLFVIADTGGQFSGIDAASGKVHEGGYTLQANVVPLAAPVAFGAKEVMAPLMDGTVFVLALEQIKK